VHVEAAGIGWVLTLIAGVLVGRYWLGPKLRQWSPDTPVSSMESSVVGRRLEFGGLILVQLAFVGWLISPIIGWRLTVPFLPFWTHVVGGALLILGILLVLWSRRHLGGNWIPGVGLRENHTLVTTGPYRRIRHPIYVGFFLALTGNMFLMHDPVFALGAAALLTGFGLRIPAEERLMSEQFGEEYHLYRQRSGLFWPRCIFRRH
jgi:protein-S-isoprenylcysteine O-methyltransferase Ste14